MRPYVAIVVAIIGATHKLRHDGRRSSQVDSYRPGIRPFKFLAVRLGRQLPVGILGRLLDRKAQGKFRRSP